MLICDRAIHLINVSTGFIYSYLAVTSKLKKKLGFIFSSLHLQVSMVLFECMFMFTFIFNLYVCFNIIPVYQQITLFLPLIISVLVGGQGDIYKLYIYRTSTRVC